MTPNQVLTRFQRWHLPLLGAPEIGTVLIDDAASLLQLERAPNNWTLVVEGMPIAAGGTLEQWPGRHLAWAHLGPETARHMLSITRIASVALAKPVGRIEMTVRMDFPAGHKWARMLGFKVETACLEGYDPDGSDHVGYVRINRG